MTYLRCILETWKHPDLIRFTLRYMLALPTDSPNDTRSSRPTTLARRRKSETLILNRANGPEEPSPDIITLSGIITGYLKSQNQQTINAALRLVSTISYSHHEFAVSTLIEISYTAGLGRDLEAHTKGTERLLWLAEDLLDVEGLEESFRTHLDDAYTMIEAHSCSSLLLALPNPDGFSSENTISSRSQDNVQLLRKHCLNPTSPLLRSLYSLLDDFLLNDIETNLSLTQTFASLASCALVQLEGWLLEKEAPDMGKEESGFQEPQHQSEVETDLQPTSESPIFASLESLVRRVETFRNDIQDFDMHLAERRHVFNVGEQIDNALFEARAPDRRSQDSTDISPSRLRGLAPISSISERLKSSSNASRSSSPRGRKEENRQPSSIAGRLSHLRLSPSPSPSKASDRKYSPSPLRKDSLSSTGSRLPQVPQDPPNALHQKVRLTAGRAKTCGWRSGSEASSVRSESELTTDFREISLSHLLTNVIILQEFLLELAAIGQVRASLFAGIEFGQASTRYIATQS